MVTGAIYKGFVFDGIDSKQYGVYITGQGVFDAPVRDVEMIEIPGRNGSYALDKGRFKNIEVTYPAGTFGNSETEFAQAISDFRNALASRFKYCRLTDEYNPNEYRMAVYKGGLEVSPAQLKAGEFDITFDCKPQRFLISGETEQTISSGATVTNPTLFDSHPLLLVDGYGDININDDVISIQQGAVIGDTTLYNGGTMFSSPIYEIPLNNALYFNGDTITVTSQSAGLNRIISIKERFEVLQGYEIQSIEAETIPDNIEVAIGRINEKTFDLTVSYNGTTEFTAGTSSTAPTRQATFKITATYNGNEVITRVSPQLILSYTAGTSDKITARGYIALNGANIYQNKSVYFLSVSLISVYSTKSALGQLYIDLDIGECYRIENGQYISINTATILPADLPTLKPGENTITYDNTFTSFKITPRWWQI